MADTIECQSENDLSVLPFHFLMSILYLLYSCACKNYIVLLELCQKKVSQWYVDLLETKFIYLFIVPLSFLIFILFFFFF